MGGPPMGPASGGPMGVPGGGGGYGQPQAAAAQPTTLLGEAKLAFSQGNNHDGFQYLYAHYLCGDTGAADVQSHMRWSQVLKRHTVAVQFGIGIVYSAPRDYTGNPMAIGNDAANRAQQTAGAEGRRRKGRNTGGGGAGGPPGAPPGGPGAGNFAAPGGGGNSAPTGTRGSLDYYTGELGELLLTRLEAKIDEGAFGDVQREMDMPVAAPANQGFNAAAAAPPADVAGAEPGGEPGGDPGAGGGAPAAAQASGESGSIRPGITFLGVAASKEALEKMAKEQGVDVLIAYDVKIARAGKTKIVNNTTKISVNLVENPLAVPIHTSASLTNVKVANEREKEKEDDPVDQEVDKLIARLETFTTPTGTPQTLKVAPFLDTLAPQHAANRVTGLTASQSEDPLRDLAEIKVYHAKKLITDQQFQDAVKALLKDKAELLSKGTEKERREAVAALLPRPGVK